MTSSTPHEHSKNITSISMDWKEFSRRNSEAEEEFNSTTINCKHREKLRNSGIFSSSITEDKQKAEIILVELVIDAIGKGQLSCPDNTREVIQGKTQSLSPYMHNFLQAGICKIS